jgi:hypothetical protein
MQNRLSPGLATVLGLLALGVIAWTGNWQHSHRPISLEGNLDATLDISSLENEAQQALPSSGLSQVISSTGSVLKTQALSEMSGSEFQDDSTSDDSGSSEGSNSHILSGTVQGTGMTVDLQTVGDGSADSLKGTVSKARSERQKLQSRINKLEAATQMLSSPTNRGEGASYSSDNEVTVAGGGFITNVAPTAPLADCTGVGCVQRLPGLPAVPGRLALPGHTITDIDATLPGRVARDTVAQFLPQVQPLLAQIAAEDNSRFEYEGGEIRALSTASRQNNRKVPCPPAEPIILLSVLISKQITRTRPRASHRRSPSCTLSPPRCGPRHASWPESSPASAPSSRSSARRACEASRVRSPSSHPHLPAPPPFLPHPAPQHLISK